MPYTWRVFVFFPISFIQCPLVNIPEKEAENGLFSG